MITFEQIITLSKNVGRNPIIACIGSTKSISDSFGPTVGQLLVEKYRVKATVVGTLLSPLHAVNLINKMRTATSVNPYSKVIAIDAYEPSDNKDSIKILNGGIKPGLATGKNLPRIGDFSIIASTFRYNGNVCCLGRVYTIADKVAKLVSYVVNANVSSVSPTQILDASSLLSKL